MTKIGDALSAWADYLEPHDKFTIKKVACDDDGGFKYPVLAKDGKVTREHGSLQFRAKYEGCFLKGTEDLTVRRREPKKMDEEIPFDVTSRASDGKTLNMKATCPRHPEDKTDGFCQIEMPEDLIEITSGNFLNGSNQDCIEPLLPENYNDLEGSQRDSLHREASDTCGYKTRGFDESLKLGFSEEFEGVFASSLGFLYFGVLTDSIDGNHDHIFDVNLLRELAGDKQALLKAIDSLKIEKYTDGKRDTGKEQEVRDRIKSAIENDSLEELLGSLKEAWG